MKLFAIVLFGLASPALAATDPSTATLYSGYYHASKGYAPRAVVGSFGDLYSGSTGIHFDLAYLDREQKAGFGAAGLSFDLGQGSRLKMMAGSSTANDNILPSLFLMSSLQFKPRDKWVVTPQLVYRRYRSGGSEIAPSIQAAHYFNMGDAKRGYFVAQGDAGLSFTTGRNTGWSAGAGLTSVRANGLTFGANVRAGYMAYDSIIGSDVRSSFYGGGATIGHRLSSRYDLYVRGDVTHTRFYTVSGAMLGLKVKL